MKHALAAVLALGLLIGNRPSPSPVDDALIAGDSLPPRLADFGFFTDRAATRPNARVLAYALNTPLFSDYSDKQRFIYLPPGTRLGWRDTGVLEFPVGAAIIKSFGYPADMRSPGGAYRMLETRVLLHRASGWVALPYVWNAERTDAVLRRGGTRLAVDWIDTMGQAQSISYAVPNQNQCKECHSSGGALVPIGPRGDNLNDGTRLQHWASLGLVDLPARLPRLVRWDDAAAPVADRARAYLDVNCAHCHNRTGSASNSGLYLGVGERDPVALGIGKRPVAAGRGSGGFDFAIEPGHPARSILVHRMRSTEPGIAMPEIGRATVHDEAVGLIESWIAAMQSAG